MPAKTRTHITPTQIAAAYKALGLTTTEAHEIWIGADEIRTHQNQADGTTTSTSIPIRAG